MGILEVLGEATHLEGGILISGFSKAPGINLTLWGHMAR